MTQKKSQEKKTIRAFTLLGSAALSSTVFLALPLSTAIDRAIAQTPVPTEPSSPPAAPTVRYARGEDVPLSEIISEWRGYYEDVPVYLCICQDDTCDQTQQWPYREYSRFQLGLALGPTNGRVAEDSGANCFDIADNSRPDNPRDFSAAQTGGQTESESAAPPTPPDAPAPPPEEANTGADTITAPVAPPPENAPNSPPASPSSGVSSGVPIATAVNDGSAVRLTWPSGVSNDIAVAGSTWNINILDALDCTSTSVVEQKTMAAQRITGEVAVDGETGNVAIPVLLDSCVDTDQSAVFVIDPNEGGSYALYRAQLPGSRNFPNEFSSYPFSSITDLRYWNGTLYVQQGTASGAESVVIFRADRTPSGDYAGCGVVSVGEGADRLCPGQ